MAYNKTTNPAFTNYFWSDYDPSARKMTVTGIIVKSLFCIAIIAGVTMYIWQLQTQGVDMSWFTLGGIIASIIISVTISVRRHWAYFLVPLYALAKGCFLGGFSAMVKVKFPEMPYQAIGVTIVTFFTMLGLYQFRLIVVTHQFRSVVIASATSIFMVYIVSWILSFFGIQSFIWGTSLPAIAFNVFAAIIASLSLLLDFDYIERKKNRAPKSSEWLATWGLLVTLIWLYTEILRLMRKLAIRF